ncbi:hypothetical protein AAHZ94_31960, partial [Streptomyces sp. HSW2009]|uniref:hypothetical protein n=1 Tax=Streptomyces sp. HSW2009 TaxID=3142890 RepID=UPI0032EAE68C
MHDRRTTAPGPWPRRPGGPRPPPRGGGPPPPAPRGGGGGACEREPEGVERLVRVGAGCAGLRL